MKTPKSAISLLSLLSLFLWRSLVPRPPFGLKVSLGPKERGRGGKRGQPEKKKERKGFLVGVTHNNHRIITPKRSQGENNNRVKASSSAYLRAYVSVLRLFFSVVGFRFLGIPSSLDPLPSRLLRGRVRSSGLGRRGLFAPCPILSFDGGGGGGRGTGKKGKRSFLVRSLALVRPLLRWLAGVVDSRSSSSSLAFGGEGEEEAGRSPSHFVPPSSRPASEGKEDLAGK